MIALTDTAAAKVKQLLASEDAADLALRVAVRPGGCSGYSYEMFFEPDITADDEQATFGDDGLVKVVVDPAVGPAADRRHARLQGRSRPVRVRHHEPERHPQLRLRAELLLTLRFQLDGRSVEVTDDGVSLLDALRGRLGVHTAKDGCSPQGQCGCCTVWVDGQPRVACVTPLARVAGRSVTTLDGLAEADAWCDTFAAHGATQCGFCTPGIIMRVAALTPEQRQSSVAIDRALAAHLCRCTGWVGIGVAVGAFPEPTHDRDPAASARRAALEGGSAQSVGAAAAGGRGGFADDTAPADAPSPYRGPTVRGWWPGIS